jgi:hypothetical protein
MPQTEVAPVGSGLDVVEIGEDRPGNPADVEAALERYDGGTSTVVIEIEYVQIGGATPSVSAIIGYAVTLGLRIGGICGAGSVPGSQHQHCNAVDLFASSYGALVAAFTSMLVAARTGFIPCAELIGPGGSGKGLIATAANGWNLYPYTGPNSHQGHIHASGSPLM